MAEKKQVSVSATSDVPQHEPDHHERTTVAEPNLVSWPQRSQILTDGRFKSFCMNVYDAGLIAIPLLLILKTTACIVDYKSQQRLRADDDILGEATLLTTRLLTELNAQLVTLLTIIFVVIISTACRRYALYKAQRGAYVSDLEQLQGSTSMTTTAKLIWNLRKFDKISLLLLFVWCFYYLGSQACKREYMYVLSDSLHHMTGVYPSLTPALQAADGVDDVLEGIDSYSQDFVRVFRDLPRTLDPNLPPKTGLDPDGHFLIPDMHTYLQPRGLFPTGIPIPIHNPAKALYSTSFGWPLCINSEEISKSSDGYWGPAQILGSYSVQAAYLQVDCGAVELMEIEDFPSGTLDSTRLSLNVTMASNITDDSLAKPTSLEVWRRWNNTKWFLDDINFDSDSGAFRVTCNVTRPHVSVHIECSPSSCLPTSVTFHAIDQKTLYKTIFDDPRWAPVLFEGVLTAYGVPTLDGTESPMEQTLDPAYYSNNYESFNRNVTFDRDVYNNRISNALNTYYAILVLGYPYSDEKALSDPAFQHVEIRKGAVYDPHHVLSIPWLVMDYVTGLLLLIAAICSLWFRKRTIAPDILGFVSSLTRDAANPHLALPVGGSTLSGLERARHMKNVKIKIGDVSGRGDEVGVVGVARVHDRATVENLHKERKYA